jgi:capsular polysaccharide biosynthesis protein
MGMIYGRGASITTRNSKDYRHVAELADISKSQRRSFVIFVIVGAILGLIVAVAYGALRPPVYEASAFADVTEVTLEAESTIYSRIDAIAASANSTAVFQKVINRLDLAETEQTLRSKVVVRPLFGNPSLRVTVTDGSPNHAAEIARGFVSAIEGLPVPERATDEPDYQIELRKPAAVPTTATTPKPSHDLISGVFLGLGLGIVVASLRRRPVEPRREVAANVE